MSSTEGLCVVCGRKTRWEEMQPVELRSPGDGSILSGVCGGCAMDVDNCAKKNRKAKKAWERGVAEGLKEVHVEVRMQGRKYHVVRR